MSGITPGQEDAGMAATPPQVYASVDWMTCTTGPSDGGPEAYSRARALAVEQEGGGNDIKPWRTHGYTGFATRHLRAGRLADDTLVELSGELADRYWREFAPLATSVSRLDTCVTVTFPRDPGALAHRAMDAERVSIRPGLKPIRKVLTYGTDGGATCNLGSPKSDRFARLYDKHVESRGEWPPFTWRWELQERRGFSRATAGALYSADDVPGAIAAYVHRYYSSHGVLPWFGSDGRHLHSPARRTRSDDDVWLAWFTRSAARGVRRRLNGAHRGAILHSIGLTEREVQP